MSKINQHLLDLEQRGLGKFSQPPTGFNDAHGEDNVWDIVKKNYPNYDKCPIIIRNNILTKLLKREYVDNDEAYKLLKSQYNGNISHPGIQEAANAILVIIYKESIKTFLEK